MDENVCFVDVATKDTTERERLVRTFYTDVYQDAFPKADQAEDPDTWLPLIGPGDEEGQPSIHITLAVTGDGAILGGLIFENYHVSECWLMTYIAVRNDVRRHGIARGLVAASLRTIEASDAARFVLLAETENPARIDEPAERAIADDRLRILDQLGLRQLPLDYVQPPLGRDKHALDDLLLLCYAPTEAHSEISGTRLAGFLREFYAALGCRDSPDLARMLEALAKIPTIMPIPLVRPGLSENKR